MASTKKGTPGDDIINVDSTVTFVNGGDGNDTINAETGHKKIFGGAGKDTITTGSGHDAVHGGTGDDTINTGAGDDFVEGGDGNDTITLGDGKNTVTGGLGDDIIHGGVNQDTYIFNIGDGHDTIYDNAGGLTSSGVSSDKLQFGAGITKEDLIFTAEGNDWLITFKNNSSDSIRIKNVMNEYYRGIDSIHFIDKSSISTSSIRFHLSSLTEGADTIDMSDFVMPVTVKALGGDDTITTGNATTTVFGGKGNDTIAATNGQLIAYGEDGDDNITGKHYSDRIFGGAGEDVIDAGSGKNYVFGGADNDTITTGSGHDAVHGGTGDDTINTGAGNDFVEGGDGNDTITLGDGKNTVTGGLGDDTIYGGANKDTYIFNIGDGHDTIYDNVSNETETGYHLDELKFGAGITKEDLIFTAEGNDWLITFKNNSSDSIRIKNVMNENYRGVDSIHFIDKSSISTSSIKFHLSGLTEGADTIDISDFVMPATVKALGGDDTITTGNATTTVFGGKGNDTIATAHGQLIAFGEDGDDNITGKYYNDRIYGGAGEDIIDAGDGTNYVFGGADNDTITTGSGHDTVYGGAGDDIIYAGNGQNTISGGLGNDTIHGGNHDDTFIFNLGDGHDTIFDNTEETAGTSFSRDKIRFGKGITSEDIVITQDGNDQLITFKNSSTDSVRIKNVASQNYLQFEYHSSSNTITGTANNDTLTSSASGNTVTGGRGDDTIYGGIGNDTYVFNIGDGHDTIYDNPDGKSGSYSDKITFGEGITFDQLTLTVDAQDWLITFKNNPADSIRVKNVMTQYYSRIESLTFSDDTTISTSNI
ncbi:calcium-binding protein, partial [Halodesulfovibrio spirochaetisodalis]